MNLIRFLILICCLTLISSCTTKNIEKVAPLPKFQQTTNMKKVWSRRIGDGTNGLYLQLNPLYSSNKIFVASHNGNLYSLNALNGKVIWHQRYKENFISGISESQNLLFISTQNGDFLAINKQNGNLTWKIFLQDVILATATVSTDGKIIITHSINGNITAFATQDGHQLWQYNQAVSDFILNKSSNVTIYKKYVICSFSDGRIAILKLANGSLLWTRKIFYSIGSNQVARMSDIAMQPLVSNDIIYIAGLNAKLTALNLINAKILWQHDLSSYTKFSLQGNSLYASNINGSVFAFNKNTGAILWKNKQLQNRGVAAPIIINKKLLAVTDYKSYVYLLHTLDGSFASFHKLNLSSILSPVITHNNIIYIYTMSGRLYAYHI